MAILQNCARVSSPLGRKVPFAYPSITPISRRDSTVMASVPLPEMSENRVTGSAAVTGRASISAAASNSANSLFIIRFLLLYMLAITPKKSKNF